MRNSLKIIAAVRNANIFRKIQAEITLESFDCYHGTGQRKGNLQTGKTNSTLSDDQFREDLKSALGDEVCGNYSCMSPYLQAVGLIWGHRKKTIFCHCIKGKEYAQKSNSFITVSYIFCLVYIFYTVFLLLLKSLI